MVETDRLLYIDLHKTGCSHIRRILGEIVGGRVIGKHNRPRVMPRDRVIVGSVRNPWDWYVSLWAFGCSRQGAVYGRTTRHFTSWYYRTGLMQEMGQVRWRALPVAATVWHDVVKPARAWREVYEDPEDPNLFRRWLGLLFDRRRRFDLGEGYAFTTLSRYAGLLTYRYVKLFSRDVSTVFAGGGPRSPDELAEFDKQSNALDAAIRTESLENDLKNALCLAGYALSEEEVQRIDDAGRRKTNRSEHRPPRDYYDDETRELVAQRERLIIRKHGYMGPSVG